MSEDLVTVRLTLAEAAFLLSLAEREQKVKIAREQRHVVADGAVSKLDVSIREAVGAL